MKTLEANITLPKAFQFLFEPSRFKGAYGGRGSGKSQSFAAAALLKAMEKKTRILCAREYQNSIADSVKSLLDDLIEEHKLESFFKSTKTEIRGRNGSQFIFNGLKIDPHKIKSMEGIDICWVEEANTVSQSSLDILIPTIRKEGSELWFTYNRKDKIEPVHKMLTMRLADNEDVIHKKINYDQNPFFPKVLRIDMEFDKRNDVGRYEHIWLGYPRVFSEAQVFYGKYKIEEFEAPDDTIFYFGADWGFSVDPSVLVRFFVDMARRKLYIDYEAYRHKVDVIDLPGLFDEIPESRKWIIKADSARPETISHMQKEGFKIKAAIKGQGSVEDGIEFLKGFQLIVHPRCVRVADELRLYSYKEDRLTGDILPVLLDKDNHCMDAIRYGSEGIRKKKKVLIG